VIEVLASGAIIFFVGLDGIAYTTEEVLAVYVVRDSVIEFVEEIGT
jgi:hypothetical protein